jgi:hypothetical protein
VRMKELLITERPSDPGGVEAAFAVGVEILWHIIARSSPEHLGIYHLIEDNSRKLATFCTLKLDVYNI